MIKINIPKDDNGKVVFDPEKNTLTFKLTDSDIKKAEELDEKHIKMISHKSK